jgi:hypothetical protein
MFGFTCFVRLLTEQKLKVLCVSAVNSPFPPVLQEGRGRREKPSQKTKKPGINSTDRAYSRIILNSPYDGGTSKRSGVLKFCAANLGDL